MVKENKLKITGKMSIAELVEEYPELCEVLMEEYGFHCIGCAVSGMETLAEGAAVHGMGKEDIRVMIENLNELVEKRDLI